MKSYAEKLKDPRWQKKRLKILERDKWTCQECGNKDDTLHVHHLKYHKSGNPWSTPLKDLQTLCKDCHENIKENKNKEKEHKEKLGAAIDDFNEDQRTSLLRVANLLFLAPKQTMGMVDAMTNLAAKAYKDGIDNVK